jgi:hypothetical protein
MNKKFFPVVMTALLGVSLFFIGCGSPEDGVQGPAGSGSTSVSGSIGISALQDLIDAATVDGEKIRLSSITLTGTGILDFGNAEVQILGTLATPTSGSGIVISAAKASVAFAEGAGIVAQGTNDIIIADAAKSINASRVTGAGAILVDPVPSQNDLPKVGGVTAVENLKLTDATDGGVIAGLTVYVFGTLTVDKDSKNPTGNVAAIGTVELDGGTDTTPLDLSPATLTNVGIVGPLVAKGDEAFVKLGATISSPGVKFNLKDAADVITVKDSTEVIADVKGPGTLKLAAAVTAVTTTGNGNVTFPIATGTLTALSLENTGTITFTATTALSIPVNATFGGDVTLPGGIATSGTGTITFKGNVNLGADKAITIGATTADAVTLKAGKGIFVGGSKLVEAVAADTKFKASAAGAVLTATAATGSTPATLTLTAQGLEVTSGNLIVAKDAKFVITTVTLSVKGIISGEGALSGIVSLANTAAATNGANLAWVLGQAGITAPVLAANATLSTNASVAATATLTVAADTTLTVAADTTLTVDNGGTITLTGDGTTPAKLVLAAKVDTSAAAGGGGKLVLTGATGVLGTEGAVTPAATVTTAQLTATGPTGNAATGWTFAGTKAELNSITDIDDSAAKVFLSIEAATGTSSTAAGNVTFQAGASDTALLTKTTTVKSTG